MSKHTPGPWVFEYRDGKHPLNDCNGSRIDGLWAINGEFILGDVTGWDGGYFGPNEANARLIAAAPDMLDELRRAQGELATALRDGAEHLTPDMLRRWFNGVSAAIAKAEG
jgi:hypothetical protein